MKTRLRFTKRLAAALTLATVISSFSARADGPTDPVIQLIMPAPYEVVATGLGPNSILVAWKDVARIEQGFEVQWTTTPSDDGSWMPATQDYVTHAACTPDNNFTPPFINPNAPDQSILNQYNDPNPSRCQVLLTKVRNRTNTADIPFPFADPATNVRWFRVRSIFPNRLEVGGQKIDVPVAAARGLIRSLWSNRDPAILGPLPPVNLQLVPSFPSITLVWANAAAGDPAFTGNKVERRASTARDPIYVDLPSTSVSLFDGPLEYNTTYTYRVSAKRSVPIPLPADPNTGFEGDLTHQEEAFSASHPANGGVTVTTPPIPAPGDPTNLIATFTPPPIGCIPSSNNTCDRGTANLQWFDNAADEDGFLIEFGSNGTTWLAQTAVGPKSGTGFVTYSQFGILPDTIRYYRVFAYRVTPYAKSNPSNVASIIAIPKAPTNLTQTGITSATTTLKFKDNSNVESGFRVQWCNPTGFSCPDYGPGDWLTAGMPLPPSPGTGGMMTFVDGRFASTTLKYRVVAFNGSGDSLPTNTLSSTTPSSPLNAPSNLVAIADGSDPHKITLTWQDNTNNLDLQPNTPDDEEEAFRIEYADPGLPFQTLTSVSTDVVTHIDLTVPGKTTRCYRVRAVIASQGRISDPSNKSCALTVAGPIPNAPSNLIAVPWSVNPTMAVELTWNDNSGPDNSPFSEDGFIIERSENQVDWKEVGRTIKNVTLFRIGNYRPNSFQYFRVKAFNFNGHSGYSNVAQVLMKGPPPPVWLNPSKDNTVAATACSVDGSYTFNFAPPVTDIAVQIVRKVGVEPGVYTCSSTPGSCTWSNDLPVPEVPNGANQVQMNWNGNGTFKLNFYFRKAITYELHARAINADGASADAVIWTFAVAADCYLGG